MKISNIKVKNRFRKDVGNLEELKNSIQEIGLLQPIVVDENNNLIAGYRRLLAFKELGKTDIPVYVIKIENVLRGEYDENVIRKSFTPSESVAIWEAMEGQSGLRTDLRDIVPEVSSPRKQASRFLGASEKTLSRAKQVVEFGDEEIIKEMDKSDNVNRAYKTIKRKKLTKKLETQELPKDKYNIILADPPWKYWESGNKNQSLHYNTLSSNAIVNIPVAKLADDNCILFLWATWVILPEALKLIEAWGFKYSTVGFVWAKSKKDKTGFAFGCGSWTRANTEFCLIAIKGNIPRKDASVSQIIYEPKREHSRKPDIVRNKIIQLVGNLPRIELFARTKSVGWEVWGNEPNKFLRK